MPTTTDAIDSDTYGSADAMRPARIPDPRRPLHEALPLWVRRPSGRVTDLRLALPRRGAGAEGGRRRPPGQGATR